MRYELKFNISHTDIPSLIQWLSNRKGFHKSFPNREVYSIYLDTIALDCAYENLCGISNRKKYRIRWYKNNGTFYGARYELKIKNASLGTKKVLSSEIPPDTLLQMTSSEILDAIAKESLGSIWEIFPLLLPNLLVQYEREYFEAYKGIRMTLDTNLQYNEILNDGYHRAYEKKSYSGVIVELKFDPQYRDLIAEMMQNFPFYPVRTSKYVLGLSYFNKVNYI